MNRILTLSIDSHINKDDINKLGLQLLNQSFIDYHCMIGYNEVLHNNIVPKHQHLLSSYDQTKFIFEKIGYGSYLSLFQKINCNKFNLFIIIPDCILMHKDCIENLLKKSISTLETFDCLIFESNTQINSYNNIINQEIKNKNSIVIFQNKFLNYCISNNIEPLELICRETISSIKLNKYKTNEFNLLYNNLSSNVNLMNEEKFGLLFLKEKDEGDIVDSYIFINKYNDKIFNIENNKLGRLIEFNDSFLSIEWQKDNNWILHKYSRQTDQNNNHFFQAQN